MEEALTNHLLIPWIIRVIQVWDAVQLDNYVHFFDDWSFILSKVFLLSTYHDDTSQISSPKTPNRILWMPPSQQSDIETTQ